MSLNTTEGQSGKCVQTMVIRHFGFISSENCEDTLTLAELGIHFLRSNRCSSGCSWSLALSLVKFTLCLGSRMCPFCGLSCELVGCDRSEYYGGGREFLV